MSGRSDRGVHVLEDLKKFNLNANPQMPSSLANVSTNSRAAFSTGYVLKIFWDWSSHQSSFLFTLTPGILLYHFESIRNLVMYGP